MLRSRFWTMYRRRAPLTGGLALAAGGIAYYSSSTKISLEPVRSPENYSVNDLRRRELVAEAMLHENAGMFVGPQGSGVARYDVCQIASNDPGEDEHAEAIYPYPNGYWAMFSVFDGHLGPQTSAWLRDNLLYAVVGSLVDLYSQVKSVSEDNEPSAADIERTLKSTFKSVDDNLVHETVERALKATPEQSRHDIATLLSPTLSGSCAALAFYDSHSRLLHVACTGDSRAVLGRLVPNTGNTGHAYDTRELSVDQNGSNPAEEMRLLAEHPGETVVQRGRVLGWGVSRAFGDANYKLPLDIQEELKNKSLLHHIPSDVKTPPYFTAEPEVTTTRIEPGDFLIIASDGLWECLGSHEAVGLIGWWQNARRTASDLAGSRSTDGILEPQDLPLLHYDDFEDETLRYKHWRLKKQFVNSDANAATHLMRNALCGVHAAHRTDILHLQAPHSRNKRDDITVTVVFFD